jgi:V8-like Glu-specific endopeptidase
MASLFNSISKFAKSKQGRELAEKAKQVAKDPKTRKQIDDARRKFMGGGKTR